MSPLMILGIVFGSITLYGFGAGVTHRLLGGGPGFDKALKNDNDFFFLLGIMLWPVVLPALLGSALFKKPTQENLPPAKVHRRLDE